MTSLDLLSRFPADIYELRSRETEIFYLTYHRKDVPFLGSMFEDIGSDLEGSRRACARSTREIPLVTKCVRLIGRRGTRARISRVHSRLPRIITHA